MPFTAAHTYIAHIWQYPPPPLPTAPGCTNQYFPLLTPTEECKVDKTKNYESQDIAIPFLCSTELSDQKDEQNLSNIKKVALVIRLETLKTGNKLSPKTKTCHLKPFRNWRCHSIACSFF